MQPFTVIMLLSSTALVSAHSENKFYPPPPPISDYPAPSDYAPAPPSYAPADNYAPVGYSYGYKVYNKDSYGNVQNMDKEEKRNGDETDGHYSVLLPDGRTEHVKYYVKGNSGFVADVTYTGAASYPAPSYSAPSYSPPSYSSYPAVPPPTVYYRSAAPEASEKEGSDSSKEEKEDSSSGSE